MRKITVSDYTLREMGESGSSRLLFREKLAIALAIDRYGADVIELPPVRNPKEDRIIFSTIAQSVKDSAVAVPAGSSVEEVKCASECLKGASHARIIVSLPVSTVQMEYMYRLKAPKMIDKICELVTAARALCDDVEFEALDATRSESDFLVEAAKAAKDSGASSLTLCDDAGVMLPEEFAALVKAVKGGVDIDVAAKVSDQIGLAVADALVALLAGADGVKVCVSGKGTLSTELFAQALKTKGEQIGVASGLKLTELHSDIESLMKNIQSRPNREAEHDMTGVSVFLDSESTLAQVKEAVISLGYDLSYEDLGKIHEAILRLCEKKSSIGGRELEAVIASSAMQVPATYKLSNYIGTMSHSVNSVTNVILDRKGERLSGTGTGNGPIDSAFMAIEQCIGHHYELDDFQIQAVTEGRESLGSALVRLRNNGKLYSGNGISSDIVGASIRAYINALNKIVYEESQR